MFGKYLRQARTDKGLTLEQLATLYNERFGGGLSKGTISKYENDRQEPMVSVVSNLSVILNVSSDYLLGREQISNDNNAKPLENRRRIISMLDQLSEERQRVIENLIVLEWNQQQQK